MSLSCGGFSHALQGCSATPVARLQLWQPKISPEWPWGANHSWNRNSEGQKPPAGSHLPWLVCPLCLLPNCTPPWRAIPSLQSQEVVHICGNQLYWGSLCLIVTYFHKNCQQREDKAHTQQWRQSWHSKTNFTRNKYGREKMWFK